MVYSYPVKVNEMIAKSMSETTRRSICVLFPGALGDFLCFLPALQLLAADAQVDLFACTEFADLVPPTVKVRSSECYEITRLFVPDAAKEQRLHEFFGAYTSIYSWLGSQQVEFVSRLKLMSQGRARIYPFRPDGNPMHQRDYYLSCLGARKPCQQIPMLALRAEAVAWAEGYWRRQFLGGKGVLVLTPGSGAREKNWPAEYFRAVAQWWRDETRGAVVVLIGPVEEDRGGWGPLLDHSVFARSLNLAQVAALLARSDLYLGNDSGITHLAAALGVRTVALFGPSDVRQWKPQGERVTVLNRNIECSPCERDVMEACPHRKCLTALTPSEVIPKLVQLLKLATLTRSGAGIRV